jgi:kynurenine formamidase
MSIHNKSKEISPQNMWWPSEWGATDQRGAANRLNFKNVLMAAELIKEGAVYQLGRVYDEQMPMYGDRQYRLSIAKSPSAEPLGSNQLVYHEETISGQIGQVGTQLDGLGHVGISMNGRDIFYNGFAASDFASPEGLKKLGIENVGPIITRGILLDVAAFRSVGQLSNDYIVTVEDIEQTLKWAAIDIMEGDVVLIRTGHGRLWMHDNDKYHAGEPGPGITALKWLSAKPIVVLGADNWGVEAVPGENKGCFFEGHQWTITRSGVYLLENLNLEELAYNKVYEFAFIFTPVPFKGAAGSPGNPIAIC